MGGLGIALALARQAGSSALAFLAKLNGWQILCIALALVAAVQTIRVNHWMHRAHGDEAKLEQSARQIGDLEKSIATLKDGIAKQNAAVKALAVESDRQKANAAKAVLNAQGRAKAAEATSSKLIASATSKASVSRPCDASKELQNAWR